jgi:hypothetical protein
MCLTTSLSFLLSLYLHCHHFKNNKGQLSIILKEFTFIAQNCFKFEIIAFIVDITAIDTFIMEYKHAAKLIEFINIVMIPRKVPNLDS